MTRLGAPRRLLSRIALVPDETDSRMALEERLDLVCEEHIPALAQALQDLAEDLRGIREAIEATNKRLDVVVDESTRRSEASLSQVVTEVQRFQFQLDELTKR